MCGRYGRRADKQRIAEWMQKHDTNVFEIDDGYLAPSYNVCPQSFQPVVRLDAETGKRELAIMRWGLVPFWSKDGKISLQHHQCQGGNSGNERHVQGAIQAPPLPGSGGPVL